MTEGWDMPLSSHLSFKDFGDNIMPKKKQALKYFSYYQIVRGKARVLTFLCQMSPKGEWSESINGSNEDQITFYPLHLHIRECRI